MNKQDVKTEFKCSFEEVDELDSGRNYKIKVFGFFEPINLEVPQIWEGRDRSRSQRRTTSALYVEIVISN